MDTDKTRTPHLKHRYEKGASDAFNVLMADEFTLTLQEAELQHWT